MEGSRDVAGLPLGRLPDIKEHGAFTHLGVGLLRTDVAPFTFIMFPSQPTHVTS
jgi:hypothetical protein